MLWLYNVYYGRGRVKRNYGLIVRRRRWRRRRDTTDRPRNRCLFYYYYYYYYMHSAVLMNENIISDIIRRDVGNNIFATFIVYSSIYHYHTTCVCHVFSLLFYINIIAVLIFAHTILLYCIIMDYSTIAPGVYYSPIQL